MYRKSLHILGHPFDGTPVIDEDIRGAFLPFVSAIGRPTSEASSFTPTLNLLSDAEIERNEKEREKELKRKKRQTKGRAKLVLPDREPQKTQRTMPGAAEIQGTMPPPVAPTIGRRAAAAAAATIASLAASENSDRERPYGQPAPPVVYNDRHAHAAPAIALPKAKRQKTVHLRPPTLPSDIYTPRAGLSLSYPTPSTSRKSKNRKQQRPRGEEEGSDRDSDAQAGRKSDRPKPSGSRPQTAKEINEAKIKEYADTQHPCMIDGRWHCSNCGCPDEVAVGRRKGPLGEKTMCGDCGMYCMLSCEIISMAELSIVHLGKYYHRHRRPNDAVGYHTDPEFHLNKRREATEAKRAKKKGGTRAAAVAAAAAIASTGLGALPSDDTPLSALDDDDDDDDDDDLPLATRRSKPPSVVPTRIYSPPLSSPPSLKDEARDPTPERPVKPEPQPAPIVSTPIVPTRPALNGTSANSSNSLSNSQISPHIASASPSQPRKVAKAPPVPHMLCVGPILC